ncbi:MAG: bifunctional nuclease family protein [Kiritimatiellae bacterium]|nr:bifunctional nuclease family protein [Kiritimatiellia bacterium]
MIRVKVEQLFLSNVGFAVLLKSLGDDRSLPIMIGAAEAQAIALHINNIDVPRPLTHDLFKNVLEEFDCRMKRMEISELREGTFYAKLILDADGDELEVDSRPSDAIALALRFGSPIFVNEEIMAEAGRVFSEDDLKPNTPKDEHEEQPTRELSPLEVLNKDMSKAIAEERYEDCARIRDKINQLETFKHSHS